MKKKTTWRKQIATLLVGALLAGAIGMDTALAGVAGIDSGSDTVDSMGSITADVFSDMKETEKDSAEMNALLTECETVEAGESETTLGKGQTVSVASVQVNNWCVTAYAITSAGDLYSWGYNRYGQVGNGTKTDQTTPVKVLGNVRSVSVKRYGYGVAAITEKGNLYCWGENQFGQVGNGTCTDQTTPVKVLNNVRSVLGSDTRMAITESGDLYGWGRNDYGQAGNGRKNSLQAVPVKILSNVRSVPFVSMAITEGGDLYGWGRNDGGYVGDGTKTDQAAPVKVLSDVHSVFSVGYAVMAITKGGDLYGWGSNWYGQVGNGHVTYNSFESQTTPVKILSNVQSISSQRSTVAAITKEGDLYCWGANRCGQVGNGTKTDQGRPVKVLGNVRYITYFADTVMAITEDRELYCWGYNQYGQVGNGTTEDQAVPVKVLNNVDFVASFDSWYPTVRVVTEEGDLYSWGRNQYGQVGNGTTENQTTPVKVLSGVRTISCDEGDVMAITKSGDLYCWGANGYGQAGNGTKKIQTTPVEILSNVRSAFINDGTAVAITEKGDMYSWGRNQYGQVGNGKKIDQTTPIKILFPDPSEGGDGNNQDDNPQITTLLSKVSRLTLSDYNDKSVADEAVISGQIYLKDGETATDEEWKKIAGSIRWFSSDMSVAEQVVSCQPALGGTGSSSSEVRIAVYVPLKSIGITTITGLLNDLSASCTITAGDMAAGGCIFINKTVNDLEGCTIALSGTLTLEDSVEASEANLQAAIDMLKFQSSDDSKAKVLACNAVKSKDYRSATLEIWTTLYNRGEVAVTVTTADGHASICKITIAENTSGDGTSYEGEYESEMREFLLNKGTFNTLKYLCNSANFPASTFVAEKDATFGELLTMELTDTYYRGWDGWKDLIDGSTSVMKAEKIIASLLGAYQMKIKGLSEAKTVQKYAKMLEDAFVDYSQASNLFEAMHSDEIEVVRKYFSESNLAKLLYKGEYDDLKVPVNQILQDEKMHQILQAGTQSEVFQQGSEASKSWNKMMEGFTQSAEVSKTIEKGWKKKVGGLEIGGGISDLKDALKFISFAQDTVNYILRLESILTADEIYCEMLLYIQENCVYSVVQEAAGNLYSIIKGGMGEIISDIRRKAMDKGGEKLFDKALDFACKKSLPFTIIKGGFDWGVTLSETLFKTGDLQELKDSLRSQAFLANCLGRWVLKNQMEYVSATGQAGEMENGKGLYYSLYMLWEARKSAEETLQSLLKTSDAEWSSYYSASTRISSMLELYEERIFSEGNMESLLEISVSCPVDVEVYDQSGTKLLAVKDGTECQGYKNGIYYSSVYNPLSNDYGKYIYYEESAGYDVRIVGNDLGIADCTVSRIGEGGSVKEFYFENMEIEKGTVINLDGITKDSVSYIITDADGKETSESMESRKKDRIATHSISLHTDSLELTVGEKRLLTVSFTPVNATNQKVAWSSSDSNVVSVNGDGVVVAVAAGTAEVTVSQGKLNRTCRITVKEQYNPSQNGGSTTPSGDGTVPSGGSTASSGNGTVSSGGSTASSGNGTAPSGGSTAPSGDGTVPSGGSTIPFGTSTIPSGSSTVPSGSNTIPSSGNTTPSDDSAAPSGSGTTPSSDGKIPSDGNTVPSDSGSIGNGENKLTVKRMTLSKTSYVYDGKAKMPVVTVFDDGGNRIPGTYYTISYSSNKKVGRASVTVELRNGYSGVLKSGFTIRPKGTKLISVSGKLKSVSIKWEKQKIQVTGYHLQYSTKSKFPKKATVTKTIQKISTTKLTARKLKAEKTYYVRIRTYKTVGKEKYCSVWSKVRKVKVKK